MHGQIGNQHMFHDSQYKYLYFVEDGKELLFDTSADRNDMINIKGEKLEKIRKKFIEHLTEEGNSHVVNGKLVNLKKEKPPINQVKAMDPSGLEPVATMSGIMRNILHIH